MSIPNFTKHSKRNSKKDKKARRNKLKYRQYLKKQRAKAARRRVRKEKHRRKHPQQTMSRGMWTTFARYIIDRVKLREHLEKCVSYKKKPNSKFSLIDIIVGLVALIVFGLPRVYDVARYQEHKLLAQALKMERMFSHHTVYRFLKEFALLTLSRQLQKANSKMLKALWESDKVIIVDGDSSTLRSYPNKKQGAVKGFNKLRQGQPCYQAIAYFVNGFCAQSKVVAGNEVPVDSLSLFTDLQQVRRLCGRIDWIRLDAGYIAELNLRRLDEFSCVGNSREKVRFIVNIGKVPLGVRQALETANCRPWRRVKRSVFIQDLPKVQVYENYSALHRLILVKRYFEQEKKWKYYALVTNETVMDAVELYHFYHQRQCIEDFFDESKNSYFLEHLPSSKLLGNSLYFNIICLAFNLLVLFRHEVLAPKDRWIQLKTVRKRYLELDVGWDGQALTISRHLSCYRSILMILRRLKKLGIAMEYKLCG